MDVLGATTITAEPVTVDWSPYENYQFDCAATCDISTPCRPPQWTFEGEPVQVDGGRLFVDGNGSLYIDTENDTDQGDSRIGTYTCNITNGYSWKTINATIKGNSKFIID